jgi:DNA (cytosine-5)-methyltransferase 1
MLYGLDCFSGIGGKTYALQGLVEPVAYCEIDKFCQKVLKENMRKGNIPKAPVLEDIRSVSKKDLSRKIDIIYGGFPCQDISSIGLGKGLEGERSGLFNEVIRLVKECKPEFVFLENVAAIVNNGLQEVIDSLSKSGYDCRWEITSAAFFGAPHLRERFYILARSRNSEGTNSKVSKTIGMRKSTNKKMGNTETRERKRIEGNDNKNSGRSSNTSSIFVSKIKTNWRSEPTVGRISNGVPDRLHRCAALGNSVVPVCVRYAFLHLLTLKIK